MKSSPPSRAPTLLLAFALALGVAVSGGEAFRRGASARSPADAPANPSTVAAAVPDILAPAPDIGASPTATPTTFADALGLATAGHFPEAADLAAQVSPDLRFASLASVFSLWAQSHPQHAATAALALSDDAERNIAWHAVVLAWSEHAPAALAAHALSLANDEVARDLALAAALPRWLERDEQAVRDWVGALPSAPETDDAVALVACHPALVERHPDLALAWAETIHDPRLRSRTLGQILRAWLPTGVDDAIRYTRQSPDILAAEKEDILVGERFSAHP